MNIKISILCPSKHCKKCKRLISFVEETINELKIEAEIEFISDFGEMLKYHTWILPSLFVNNQVVSRGYIPAKEKFITVINNFLTK
jgi:hypothetical protein